MPPIETAGTDADLDTDDDDDDDDESPFAAARVQFNELEQHMRKGAALVKARGEAGNNTLALVREEVLYYVVPMFRALLDTCEQDESEVSEGFDEVYESIEGIEGRIAQAAVTAQHAGYAQTLAAYIVQHYPEDEQALSLAKAVLGTSAQVLAMLTGGVGTDDADADDAGVGAGGLEPATAADVGLGPTSTPSSTSTIPVTPEAAPAATASPSPLL